MYKKIISFLTILCMAVCCSFNVLAEGGISLYASRPEPNELSLIAQERYCSSVYPNLSEYDFIAYYTESHSWLDANTLLYGSATYSESNWSFTGMAWNDSEAEPEEITISRGFSWDGNGDYIYKFTAYDNYDNTSVLNVCADIPQPNPTIPPSLELPTPNEPSITTNVEQSTYIANNSSPAVAGGVINYFRYDFFNIYAVNSTAYDNSLGGSSDLIIKYLQDSTGRYIIPVYDHSEVVMYGANLTISTNGLQITPSLYNGVSYSFPNSTGIIQRDVHRFDYTYVDLQMLNQYPYESLPFSNSSTNTGKVEYLGQQTSVRSGGTGSRSIMVEFNGKNYSTTFHIVISDSFKDIEQAKQESNQTIINNNINNNFTQLDNTLQHGNQTSQQSNSILNNNNNSLNNTISQFNQIDNNANQNLINDLNDIPMNQYELTGIQKLTNASNFVKVQFDNLTSDNPIGISIGFGLIVGLGLLLLARRL